MSRANQNNLIKDLLQAAQDLGRLNQNPTPPTPPAPITLSTHASIVELFRSKAIVAIVAPCLKCGKPHHGEYLYGKNAYFRCGKVGYIGKDFHIFTQKKDNNSDQNKKGKARVFTLIQKDAEENSNVITGILLIFNTPAYVLFDSGATHSFASMSFIAKSSITCEKSENTLEFSVPSGRTLSTNQLAREMEVSFQKLGEEQFSFLGIKTKPHLQLVSALQAEKMMRKETCQGFLVNISGEKQTTIKIEDVPVVREFIDVFLEERPGTPPDR
ncbi:uncharacterized protein LOC111366813 [Olea europaea var. sylvestris]|uniref:uncharacterized protein LOC111366813 n=1 Tax=Olea europaea var. sylvestris TaxID=158386 RepID=UPI000C1D3C67|nr:uncharacterized protein LOC111366813 [Olea europaea var. sylvestris]